MRSLPCSSTGAFSQKHGEIRPDDITHGHCDLASVIELYGVVKLTV